MEKVIVLADVNYASDGGAGTVDTLADASNLGVGAMGIYNEEGTLLDGDVLNDGDLVDCKEFTIAANVGGVVRVGKGYIRKNISRVHTKDYSAPVFAVVSAGGTTAQTRLPFEDSDIGEVGISIGDRSFSAQYPTNQVYASVYKKASMTVENVVDALVAKINASEALPLSAVKAGSAGNFAVVVTSQTRGQELSISVSGLIEGAQLLTDGSGASVRPVNGTGVGEDVRQAEFEASMYHGNSYSRELTDNYFNQQFGANTSVNYDGIIFQEDLADPYVGETNVKPLCSIYIPTAASNNQKTTVLAVLAKLIGGIKAPETTDEPGNE